MTPVMVSCAPANFRKRRPGGFTPAAIVLHRSGSKEALGERFNDATAGTSVHYVVARDGTVEQYVDEVDTAFHAGRIGNPVWPLLRPNLNPNAYTIGIELEGRAGDGWPAAQVTAAGALISLVAARWDIPLDLDHVIPHRLIRASSGCPPADCPIELIIAIAKGHDAADAGIGEADAAAPSTDAMELARAPVRGPRVRADLEDVPIDRETFVLPPKEYFTEATRKDLIVLHFTAGTTARSAFDTWRRDPQHVATAYVVDMDGTIYEVFPPSMWAHHLGVKGTSHVHDRRSIGIEIANVGPLQVAADNSSILNWWPRRSKNHPEFTTRYCRRDETERYVQADYRGKQHFASFPHEQVDAVAALVHHLCDRFAIPSTLTPPARRYECDVNAFAGYRGVCTHANFRPDKWDIGPAFPWERLGL
jgi:N-acetyl-anhydromuramyl-L-alanine amidase AmpD